MTTSTTAVDLNSPPKFFSVWKSNLPIVVESIKLHPRLLAVLVGSGVIHALLPMAGILGSIGAMISVVFIDYTIFVAVLANINEGAPRYDVTNNDVQWKMVLTQVLVNVLTFLMTLLLIIPGIWYAIKSGFSTVLVAVEGRNSKDAISRSHELTKGNFLLTFWFRSIAPALMILGLLVVLVIAGFIVALPMALISKDLAAMTYRVMFGIFLVAFYGAYLTMTPPLVHLYAYINRKNG